LTEIYLKWAFGGKSGKCLLAQKKTHKSWLSPNFIIKEDPDFFLWKNININP
jgi:lipid-binding SYLF domain-containing protein